MTGPQAVVEEFIRSWGAGPDAFFAAVEATFTPRTVWENVGYSVTVGAADAVAHLRESMGRLGWTTVRVDVLAIAAVGDQVLTERVDHHEAADGEVLFSVRCACVFDVADGRFTAIREYFDTAPLVAKREASRDAALGSTA